MSFEDTQLYRVFLEELRDLADFRLNYSLDHPCAGLDGDDPDIKRIIEALAFFSARTRVALNRSLDSASRRLYQQFFSYMTTPLPAMAMMQAKPTGTLTEVLNLPAGSEFGLQPEKGGMILFRTARPLRILPMSLDAVKQEMAGDGKGSRLLLTFQSHYPLNEQPETLILNINYLNDLTLSLKVLHFFRQSLFQTGVQFGAYDAERSFAPCEFNLDAPIIADDMDEFLHPLELERHYFHFPQQEIYILLHLPPAPRNWGQFTVALDCRQVWPRQLRLNREIFHLYVTPVMNSQRALAQPISCSGTEDRYVIRHPEPQLGFTLQKIIGVYETGPQGMVPLRPGILAGGNGSFEIELGQPLDGGGNLYWLIPHFPAAFEQPRTLVVDALWQQPWYDQILQMPFNLYIYRRQIQGVQWELMDTVTPHAENPHINDVSRYMHLLTLMHKSRFTPANLRDLLVTLGSVSPGRFHEVFESLADLTLQEETWGDRNQNKQIYHLLFKIQSDETMELIEPFVRHVRKVLDLWLADTVVEATWQKQEELRRPISHSGFPT